jgi:hypothetical protein
MCHDPVKFSPFSGTIYMPEPVTLAWALELPCPSYVGGAMLPWQGRGFRRYLFLSLSFLVGFFVRNLTSNHDPPIIFQETSNLTHCPTLKDGLQVELNNTQALKPNERPGVHTYLPNGLLQFNPNAPHPILELIKTAEEEWQKKLDSASSTLEDAVREYKRRYKRAPPQGFDDW